MELRFLGTGPHQAIPRLGCNCPACQDARRPGSRSRRRRSSLLIKSGAINILIDCGPDFLEQAKLANLKSVDAVFLTHRHWDAYGGLNLLDEWTKKSVTVYSENENVEYFKKLAFKHLVFSAIGGSPPEAGRRPGGKIGNIEITVFRVEHGLTPIKTLGYLINDKIAYASDFGNLPRETQKLLYKKSLAIFDAALYFGREFKGHLNAAQSIAWAQKLKIKKLYLTQVGHSYPPYSQAAQAIRSFLRKQQIKLEVVLGYDGLNIRN